MISRIHQRLGTAGFIISVVALVAALGGGAYAASGGLTGKQKKEVEKIAKKYAGKPGAAGPTGPTGAAGGKGDAGASGTAGTAGTAGTPGTNGKSVVLGTATSGECSSGGTTVAVEGASTKKAVCNGVTGFTEHLPAGKTETGAWAISQTATGSAGPTAAVSFPIPLSAGGLEGSAWVFTEAEVAQGKWGRKEANTSEPCTVGEPECIDTGCRGTVAVPTAPPGALCAYTEFASLIHATPPTEFVNFSFEFNAFGATGAILSGAVLTGGPAPAELASIEAVGTWAVTAP